MARDARPAVALEGLFVEEAATLFESLHQTQKLVGAVKRSGIAFEGDCVRLRREVALRFGSQDQLAHEYR